MSSQTKKLGEICDLQNGFAFKSTDYIENSNTMNFRMSQIRPDGTVDLKNNPRYLPDSFANTYKNFLLKNGDVVIAMTDLANETKILGVPTIVETAGKNLLMNQRVGKLCKIDDEIVFLPYLRYALTTPQVNKYYKSLGRGGLQINISKSDILNVRISLPTLIEQKRIALKLDEIFENIKKAKENAERNLVNAWELFEALLNEYFGHPRKGWKEMKLNDACIVERGSSPRPIKKYQTTSKDGVNWIKIGDTKGVEKYIYSTREKITKEGAEHSRFVKEGDFILTNSMSFGNPYIMKTEGYIHDGWFVLRLKEFIDTEFFWFLLVSPFVRNQFNQLASGAIVKNISGDLVKKAVLFIPPLAEQRAIVGRLEELSSETGRLEQIYKNKLTDLEELKKSVLQKAFAGEL